MKKSLLILALVSGCNLFGQVDEEAIYLTGGINFGSGDATMDFGGTAVGTDQTDFYIMAGGGYMLTEIFGVGLNLGFQNSESVTSFDSISSPSTLTVFSVAPEARAYIELDEPLYLIGVFKASLGFGKMDMDFFGETSEQNINYYDFGIRPGVSYFLSDNISLEMTVGYMGYNIVSQTVPDPFGNGNDISTSSGSFQFGADLSSVTFNFTIMLNN